MKNILTTFHYKNLEIPVFLERKGIRNAYVRYKERALYITSGPAFTEKALIDLAYNYFHSLIKKKIFDRIPPIGSDYYYYFGERVERGNLDDKKLENMLRRELRKHLEIRIREYEKIMSITEPYNIKIQKMKTRHGTNSTATHTITISLYLIHYQKEVIDSLIVHELAHHYRKDHSKYFYNIVLRYFPEYKKYDKLLNGGIFHE